MDKIEFVNGELIFEGTPKSAIERVMRHARVAGRTLERRIGPVVRRSGDNDPRRTPKGRNNFRGEKKRRLDQEKRDHPEKYREAVEFINKNYGMPISEISIENVDAAMVLINGLIRDNNSLDKSWLYEFKRKIVQK